MSFWLKTGFRQDCEQLLSNFVSSGGTLFRDFVKQWQDMKFALIFRGHPSFYEMIEFVEESFIITKSYLSPKNGLNKRIGALYTLYGLYYRQPTISNDQGYIKIRMEYQEWVDLLEMIKSLKESGCYDACVIFYKMVVDKAFHFVCFTQTYGMVERVKRRNEKDEDDPPKKKEKIELSSEILEKLLYEQDFTVSWRKKQLEYNRLKGEFKRQNIIDPEQVRETDLINDILSELTHTHVSTSSSDLGAKRRALKNRSRADISSNNQLGNRRATLASLKDQMIDEIIKEKQKDFEEMAKNEDEDGAQDTSGVVKSKRPDCGKKRDVTYVHDLEDKIGDDKISNLDDNYDNTNRSNKSLPSIITSPSIGTSYLFDGDYGNEEEIDSPSDSDCSDNSSSSSSSCASDSGSNDSDSSRERRKKKNRKEKVSEGVAADEGHCNSLLFN